MGPKTTRTGTRDRKFMEHYEGSQIQPRCITIEYILVQILPGPTRWLGQALNDVLNLKRPPCMIYRSNVYCTRLGSTGLKSPTHFLFRTYEAAASRGDRIPSPSHLVPSSKRCSRCMPFRPNTFRGWPLLWKSYHPRRDGRSPEEGEKKRSVSHFLSRRFLNSIGRSMPTLRAVRRTRSSSSMFMPGLYRSTRVT